MQSCRHQQPSSPVPSIHCLIPFQFTAFRSRPLHPLLSTAWFHSISPHFGRLVGRRNSTDIISWKVYRDQFIFIQRLQKTRENIILEIMLGKHHSGLAKRHLLELCLGRVRLAKCPGPAHSKENNQIMGLLSNHTSKIIMELKMVVLAGYDSTIQLSNHCFFFRNFTFFSCCWRLM